MVVYFFINCIIIHKSKFFYFYHLFFFIFFLKELKILNLIYLTLFALLLSFPMLYYLFVMEVNFLLAGGQYTEGKSLYYFNLSNKILIISTIFLFHFTPFILNLLNFENLKNFLKDKFIFSVYFSNFISLFF